MKKSFTTLTLEITAFITGGSVIVLELVAVRVITPFVGSTIYTWTSLIGIILLSLSLGYWYGGRIADQKQVED